MFINLNRGVGTIYIVSTVHCVSSRSGTGKKLAVRVAFLCGEKSWQVIPEEAGKLFTGPATPGCMKNISSPLAYMHEKICAVLRGFTKTEILSLVFNYLIWG